jgi:hypothetical protein
VDVVPAQGRNLFAGFLIRTQLTAAIDRIIVDLYVGMAS